jgi:hypothetical protein
MGETMPNVADGLRLPELRLAAPRRPADWNKESMMSIFSRTRDIIAANVN